MSQPKLYGFPPSTYVKTSLMVAAECGLDIELQPLDFKKSSHFALHPYGKMPVLEHDGFVLYETMAIAVYLDQVFGSGSLCPADAPSHARMWQWASAAVDYAYPALVVALLQETPSREQLTDAAEHLKLLDAGLGADQWFAGSQLSVADFMLFPMVEFALRGWTGEALRGLPNLMRWQKLMAKRPGVEQAA